MKKISYILLFFAPFLLSQNLTKNVTGTNWIFYQLGKTQTYTAQVPGTIHTDLLHHNLISDPFLTTHEKEVQWVENEDWVYETTFSLSVAECNSKNAELIFEGLDTFATVYWNGTKILEADNMFRVWKVPVNGKLKNENSLKIIFHSAVEKAKEKAAKLNYKLPDDERVHLRKAPYQFGWDWGPRLVTCGIWKNIQLRLWNSAIMENLSYEQKELSETTAKLDFKLAIDAAVAGNYQIILNQQPYSFQFSKGKNEVKIPLEIQNPILWWCNGMGSPHLYPFTFELRKNNLLIDTKTLQIGLRTLELVQENDEKGQRFYFKLNGKPVFIKGANMIPPDSFVPRIEEAVWVNLADLAANSNMNMLRVWGGGVYADDAFYNACDEKGILVWQDFMFACGMYPGDEAFLESVKNEVTDQVKRLQNHPSIAIWCGNNESDEGWHNWGWQKQYKYSTADSAAIWNNYKKLFHQLIPGTLQKILPKNEYRYWPSSPSIGWGRKESLLRGDSHYWGVWWGMEPFEKYEEKIGRFMSEYGFQGIPSPATLAKMADGEPLDFNSDILKTHQKHKTGFETIRTYMERDFPVPTNFYDFAYVSQLLQAEGIKKAIEAHRRAKPYCMGTLYWQLNDCWPVTSWSSTDYYGDWKALQYQVKRSYKPVILSVKNENGTAKIYAINDTDETIIAFLTIRIFDFNGAVIREYTKSITITPNSSSDYITIPDVDDSLKNKTVLHASLSSEKYTDQTFFYWVKPKELLLNKPNIQWKFTDPNTIQLTTDTLTKGVCLSSLENTHFSDNYFDLLPGETREITLSTAVQTISVKSLFEVKN